MNKIDKRVYDLDDRTFQFASKTRTVLAKFRISLEFRT